MYSYDASKPTRIAIIAAGGLGTRMNLFHPKSLLQVNEKFYLEILLEEITHISIDHIIIYCDSMRYFGPISGIASKFKNTIVELLQNAQSTFDLMKHGAAKYPSAEIFFLYGHTPAPRSILHEFVHSDSICTANIVNRSTKRSPIQITHSEYIEPPYKIDTSRINIADYKDWNSLFSDADRNVFGIRSQSPSEFNYQIEEVKYRKYTMSWMESNKEDQRQAT